MTGNVSSVLHNRLCVLYTCTWLLLIVPYSTGCVFCTLSTWLLLTKDMPLILCTLQLHKHLYICNIYPNCMVDCHGHISRVKGPHIGQMGSCGHWLSTTGTCLCPQWTSGKHTQKKCVVDYFDIEFHVIWRSTSLNKFVSNLPYQKLLNSGYLYIFFFPYLKFSPFTDVYHWSVFYCQ